MNEPQSFIVHKFKPITDWLEKSLADSEIYFAPPDLLNDPFDCQIDLGKARKLAQRSAGIVLTAVEEDRWEAFATNLNAKARSCGVFSICRGDLSGQNSHLLWPHYGNEHRGVCLTYRIPTDFVEKNELGIDEVKYNTESLFEAINNLKLDQIPSMLEVQPLIIAMLTTKGSAWAYEEEVRMVSFEPGAIPIPRECLVKMTFGLRVGSKERQRMMALMSGWGYQNCTFAEAYVADNGLFSLAIRELARTNI